MKVIFYASCVFLLTVFLVSMVLALHGNQAAKHFLRVWAALMILALPLVNRASMISHIAADLILMFFLYVLYITVRYEMERMDVSHEETRHVLAKSNRYIDGERCTPACRLHGEVNPRLLLTRNVLRQLEPLVTGNGRTAELLGNASGVLNDAYAEMHDIIKNTRIRVVDSVGFTAALESLVAHCTNISEKPVVTLEHDLPRRPAVPGVSIINAYKIIQGAIFNAIKHSKAARVRVSIHHNKAPGTCRAEVTDNGVGMKITARNREHAGIRLIDMRERVWVLSGVPRIQAADPASQRRPETELSFSLSGQLS